MPTRLFPDILRRTAGSVLAPTSIADDRCGLWPTGCPLMPNVGFWQIALQKAVEGGAAA
jgi:hypothetical protein